MQTLMYGDDEVQDLDPAPLLRHEAVAACVRTTGRIEPDPSWREAYEAGILRGGGAGASAAPDGRTAHATAPTG